MEAQDESWNKEAVETNTDEGRTAEALFRQLQVDEMALGFPPPCLAHLAASAGPSSTFPR